MSKCPWCDIASKNNVTCNPDDCDFRYLSTERSAILDRIQRESDNISMMKNDILRDKLPREDIRRKITSILDKAKGIEVMMAALKEYYDMSEKDVKAMVQIDKLSMVENLKFARKAMEATRGGQ